MAHVSEGFELQPLAKLLGKIRGLVDDRAPVDHVDEAPRGSGAPAARPSSQIAMTAVLPSPVGMSTAEGKSPLRNRSNNRRCHGNG